MNPTSNHGGESTGFQSKGSLINCLQAKRDLETAISSIILAEQEIKANSNEVKFQIHSCISRHMECLRSREVYLLEQIDLVQQLKEESLQQQIQQLYWLLGQFNCLIHQLEHPQSNLPTDQIITCLERLKNLTLKPEESPTLNFEADVPSLRQAITSFGAIKTLVSETEYKSPCNMAANLDYCLVPLLAKKSFPNGKECPLADWLCSPPPAKMPILNLQDCLLKQSGQGSLPNQSAMDPDQYKMPVWGHQKGLEHWLLPDKQKSNPAENITTEQYTQTATSCNLSPENPDYYRMQAWVHRQGLEHWLFPRKQNDDTTEKTSALHRTSPTNDNPKDLNYYKLQAWGHRQGLEYWLLPDQQNSSPTKDVPARQRTESSGSSSTFELIEEFDMEVVDQEVEELNPSSGKISLTDVKRTHSEKTSGGSINEDKWKSITQPFREKYNTSEWLLKPSKAESCGSCCAVQTKAVEIENLGKLKCLSEHHSAKKPSPASPNNACHLQPPLPIRLADVCKANEQCSSFSECVCGRSCEKEAVNEWLLKQGGRDKNGVQTGQPSKHTVEQQKTDLDQWLHPQSKSIKEPPPESFVSNPVKLPESLKSSTLLNPPRNLDKSVASKRSEHTEKGAELEVENKFLLRKEAHELNGVADVSTLFSNLNLVVDREKLLAKEQSKSFGNLFAHFKEPFDPEKWLYKGPRRIEQGPRGAYIPKVSGIC
ncbi:nuclear receptor coactivator 4 isoform X2 [Heterodontus francisci]